jgi:hypothetical protein
MRMTLVVLAALTLLGTGCQCLQPVSSNIDGGPARCRSDSDCAAVGPCAVATCSAAGVCQAFSLACDAGLSCVRAADCPGAGRPCDDASGASCACGTVKTCVAGACRAFSRECPPVPDAGAECRTPADCVGPPGPAIAWCNAPGAAHWSCAFGRCVTECGAGRTCVDDGGCVACDGQTRCPEVDTCFIGNAIGVDEATCGIDTYSIFLGDPFRCVLSFNWPDGGMGGTLTWLEQGELTADIPDWGGRCVGRPSAPYHFALSCPRCMASVQREVVGP